MNTHYIRCAVFSLCLGAAFSAKAQNDPSATIGDTGTVMVTYHPLVAPAVYTTVRAADGKIWLQQNMGASRVATAINDTAAYGGLYQWGRWTDTHQLRNSSTVLAGTLSANNPSGLGTGSAMFYTGANPNDWWGGGTGTDAWNATATAGPGNGLDPCSQIGSNWHMASEAEWSNLVTLENITDKASAFASHLKLPTAGQRDGSNGNLFNVGVYGAYWTSTPSGVYAKTVAILDASINPSDDAYRSYGHSVRCVTSTCTGVTAPDTVAFAAVICAGDSILFQTPVVNNANGYLWSFPAGWSNTGTSNTVKPKAGNSGTITVRSFNNCDTSDPYSVPVTVLPAPVVTITASGTLLTATAGFSAYQWYFNGVPISSGGTGQTYTATQNGVYTVQVTNSNGCKGMSAPYNMTTVSVGQVAGGPAITIYPNPAAHMLFIETPISVTISISSLDAKVVLQQTAAKQLDISRLENGIYLVRVSDGKGRVLKMEKLVKLGE